MASALHIANRSIMVLVVVVLLFVCLLTPVASSSLLPHRPSNRDLNPAPFETGMRSLSPTAVQWPGPDYGPFSKIAFQSYRDGNWEIYAAQGDGSWPIRLTYDSATDVTPRLKRGGSQVVFASNRTGNYDIFVVNSDGSQLHQLTQITANDYNPVWSSDGGKIAFNSYRDGQSEVYVMNADGSNQTRLTVDNAYDGDPTWSPDGARLAFTSQRSGEYAIWVMNANGGSPVQLSTQPSAENPVWSPDGTKIAYDADGDNDGWQELFIMNSDGSNQRQLYDFGSQADIWAGGWSPDSLYISYAKVDWIYYQGNWYWTAAHMRAMEWFDLSHMDFIGTDTDWAPDWTTTDIIAPSTQVTAPRWTPNSFALYIIGADTGGAGIRYYKVQYRDGADGVWTDLPQTTDTTLPSPYHEYGHTYYFRSSATDNAGNVEAYPGGDGDAQTGVYKYLYTGRVLGNRDQPVTVASITTAPSAINTGLSRHDGLFDLYFASGGIYTLNTTRNAFGLLPPLFNVSVPLSMSLPPLYLPPLDDQIGDGHFESGTLSAWNPTGDLTATITSTAHTGDYAVLLGGVVPSDTVDIAPYLSTIEQTITVPMTLTDGTLSLLYNVTAADPLSDTFTAYLIGPTETLTFTLPITATAWTHQWFDVSAWTAPTATLRLELSTSGKDRAIGVLVDEVTWGSSIVGSRPIYLPVMHR